MNTIPQDDTPRKQCSKCKQWLPADADHFHRGHASKDGLYHSCKPCRKTERAHKTPQIFEDVPECMKRCTRCKLIFPLTVEYFNHHVYRPHEWQQWCRECAISRNARKARTKGPAGYKWCPDCQEWKPATQEFFVANKSERSGLNTYCRQCWSSRHRKYPIDAIPTGYKRCTKCNTILPARSENFHFQRSGKWGLASVCIPCHKQIIHAHYTQNKEVYRDRRQRFARMNPQKILEYTAHFRRKHRERLAIRRRELYALNPEKERVRNRRRRTLARSNGGNHTPTQIQELLKRQHYRCYYAACGYSKFKKVNGNYVYHVDHMVPLTRGGPNSIDNLILACPFCNQSKGAKLPHEWPQGGRLL